MITSNEPISTKSFFFTWAAPIEHQLRSSYTVLTGLCSTNKISPCRKNIIFDRSIDCFVRSWYENKRTIADSKYRFIFENVYFISENKATYFTRNDRFCFPNIVLIHVKHFNPIDTCLIWMVIQQKKGNSPKILLTKAFDWINIRNNHCDWTYLKLFQIINIFKWWQSRFWPSKKTKKWFVLKIVWLTERLLELNLHSWNLKTWKYFRAAQ